MKRIIIIIIALLAFVANPAFGQAFSTAGWWNPSTEKFSPVVNPDGSITFRVKAPKARTVNLIFGEWDVEPLPMKESTDGIWQITIPPVSAGVYEYKFEIDGVKVLDHSNPKVKAGTEVYGSIVEVVGKEPRFDQYIHSGSEVDVISYMSTPLHMRRKVYVYVPAVYYENSKIKLPVLYLRHGGGDDESSWVRSAGADAILDNLIAHGKAEPMIVVMTNGLTDGSWAGGSTAEGINLLEQELLSDVIPLIEKRYRIINNRKARAIAGLSMGGGQAFVIGMRNLDKFSAIGEFSSGLLSDSTFDYSTYGIHDINNPTKINSALDLLWISCGTKDTRWNGHLEFREILDSKGIRYDFHSSEHGHEWQFWREQLCSFAASLFHRK